MTNLKTKVSKPTAPSRSGNKVSSSWKVPAKATKKGAKDKDRFDGLNIVWVFDAAPATSGTKKGNHDVVESDTTGKEKTKKSSDSIDRNKFYPVNSAKLNTVEIWVRGYNNQGGKKVYGPWQHNSLALKAPDAPGATLSYDSDTGVVTASYSTSHPDGAKECYQTKCWVTVAGSKKVNGSAYTQTSKTIGSWEVPNAKILGMGGSATCTLSAINQGLAGNSSTTTRVVYIVHPTPATLGDPTLVYAAAGVKETAMVRVPITWTGAVKVNNTWQYPSKITLQRVKDVPTDNDPTSASQMDNWADVMSDNGDTNGLSDTWAQGVSAVGLHTWYRVKSERDGYTVLSMPVCATALDVSESSTVAGAANIDSIVAGADGKSLVLELSGKDSDDDGYEVSWSDEENAWESTKPPNTFETAGSRLVIKGLTEGTRYFVKARAYDVDADGNHVYGKYSGSRAETPYTTPSTVSLLGATATARGSALQLSWTYDTDAQQVEWRLVDESGSVFKSGKEATCACTVSPKEYGDAESLTLHVELTTGGGWAKSEERVFTFADAPTCSVSTPATLVTQPATITVQSDEGDAVAMSVTALDGGGGKMDGERGQMPGDTVWSGSFTPVWSGTGASRSATITLPGNLSLYNGSSYIVRASASNSASGLTSGLAEAVFAVNWTHTASQPAVTVVANAQDRSATISVDAPDDYEIGDRFDLYRSTPDGERMIASSLPFGTTVVDRLAPYSSKGAGLAYVAVMRTADGDTCASDDADYSIACGSLRFDWDDKHVELPYNFDASDSFEKDSEVRAHVDGTRNAYWNEPVSRSAELSTDIISIRNAEEQELVRDMLQHAGSVFVRTPDGLAFAADVRAGTIERSHESKIVGMSFTAVEHDLDDAGRPNSSDVTAPEWGGGALVERNGVVFDGNGGFPLDSWAFVGYSEGVLYVYDGESVRNGTGTEMVGWTWDGAALLDGDGNPVELDGVA